MYTFLSKLKKLFYHLNGRGLLELDNGFNCNQKIFKKLKNSCFLKAMEDMGKLSMKLLMSLKKPHTAVVDHNEAEAADKYTGSSMQ
jgi:hypothetical protein